MAENADDENENIVEDNEIPLVDVVETTGWLRRVKTCVNDEMTLLARCVSFASPDRSLASVLFLVLLATSLTCTLTRYMVVSHPERFPNYVVQWLIIGFEVVATVCLVLIWCYARNRPSDNCVADANLQPWHRFIRCNIKLFGIVPFYFAIFVFDVFRIIADLMCVDAWVACSSDVVRVEHTTDLVYPVARIVYLCVELLVCVKFNAVDFYQNTLLLVGLAVVQATNLSSWLDALVNESDVFASERNWTHELSRCFDGTDVNISEHFRQCFSRTTGEYKLLESVTPYLYPFIMEYLMQVTECVADWFFSDAGRHDGAQSAQPPRPTSSHLEHAESTSSMANNGNSGTQLVPTTSYRSTHVEQDQQPQHGANATVSRVSSSDSVLQFDARGRQSDCVPLIDARPHLSTPTVEFVHVDPDMDSVPETWCDRCPLMFFSVILSSIASFLFIIFGIYNFALGEISYRNLFVCYRSGYWLLLSLAALVGYAASRRFPSGPMHPNGFEYFVILSCIGPILQSIFTIIANVQTGGSLVPTVMFLTEAITNILQICTQIVFYAYAKSIQIRTDETNENNEYEFRCKRLTLVSVISYFAVCNAALWVEDSFIETRSSSLSWQKHYFDNWPLIYNIFNPLALMFRFNSFLLFLDVLFDKRR